MKLLIDEDLSPIVANRLRVEDGIDAVHVRDRGKLGEPDHRLLEYAYEKDRILENSHVFVVNSSLAGNTASWQGGALMNWHSEATIANSILFGNLSENPSDWVPDGGHEILNLFSGDVAHVSHSCIAGGHEGIGNIDADPLFFDVASGDLRVPASSPVVDAGDVSAVPPEVVEDLAGNDRVVGASVDMGAYETQ